MDNKKDITIEQEEIIPTATEPVESPEVAITETTVSATPTSRTRQWMQERYPEESWDSDEAFDERTAQHLAETEENLGKYKASDEAIGRILEANPEFALAINAMGQGMPARVAIRRYLGDVLAEPDEGDDDFEAYKEAADKFLAEKKAADEEIATRTANLEKSDILLKEFVESNFATEQEQVDFVEYLKASLRNIGMGEFSTQFFEMMLKAYMHDKDVEDAKEAGAIEARNERITTKRIKEATETDGMPLGGGSSPIVEEEMDEEEDAIDSVLRNHRRSIFK